MGAVHGHRLMLHCTHGLYLRTLPMYHLGVGGQRDLFGWKGAPNAIRSRFEIACHVRDVFVAVIGFMSSCEDSGRPL